MSASYVLWRMGLTAPNGSTTPAFRFLGRDLHYLQDARARSHELVHKVGHRGGSRKVPNPRFNDD